MRRARVRNRPGRPGWCFPSPAGSPRFCVSCSPLVCGCARVRLGLLNVPVCVAACVAAAASVLALLPSLRPSLLLLFPFARAPPLSPPPFSPFSRSFLPPGPVGGFRTDSDLGTVEPAGVCRGPESGQARRPGRLGSGGLSLFQALAI